MDWIQDLGSVVFAESSWYPEFAVLIGIDVTSALASQTGVGVCVRELVHAMLSSSNGGNTFRLCAVSARRDSLPRLRRAFPNEQVKFRSGVFRCDWPSRWQISRRS